MSAKRKSVVKYKVIGKQDYIDGNGEIVTMRVENTERRDFNFTKVWLPELTDSLEGILNQKSKVAFWLLNNVNRENQLIYTQEQIASKVNVSIQTVNLTLKSLMEADLIRKSNGAYIINPDIIFKGTLTAREKICDDYSASKEYNSKPKTETDKVRLYTIRKQIEKLQHKESVLQASITSTAS